MLALIELVTGRDPLCGFDVLNNQKVSVQLLNLFCTLICLLGL
jgi:hypothetical protein